MHLDVRPGQAGSAAPSPKPRERRIEPGPRRRLAGLNGVLRGFVLCCQ